MRIIIDERETSIYEKCQQILRTYTPPLTTIIIEKQVLPIGDIIYQTGDLENPQTVAIIERKTIADLLASIKDGRYSEQSYRLANQNECPLHNVVYLIEGYPSSNEKKLVTSTMASVGFFKGFSVARTGSTQETAEWIIWTADKIERNFQKRERLAYSNMTTTPADGEPTHQTSQPPQPYCSVVKKVKKDNITRENIGEIVLCQIPGISSTTAIAIMARYKSLVGLLDSLKENPACLDGLQYQDSNGKMRKISKACIESIKHLLL